MKSEVVETETDRQWLGEDGILYIECLPSVEYNLATAKCSTDTLRQVAGGKKRPVLIDIRKIKSVSREAREHFTSDYVREIASAIALLVSSPLSKTIANLVLALNNPNYPLRAFNSKTEALEWLQEFIE